MRMKSSRIRRYGLCRRSVNRDSEGGTVVSYGTAVPIYAEVWPAGGALQVEMYGDRVSSVMNMCICGTYTVDNIAGVLTYVFADGFSLRERDGVCIYGDSPDYEIRAITPYKPLKLELQRL